VPPHTAYIISLKFAPGLLKEFTNIGEKLRLRGMNIKYLLAQDYQHFHYNVPNMKYLTKSNTKKEIIVDTFKYMSPTEIKKAIPDYDNLNFVLFYNPHILNIFFARFLHKRKKSTTVLFLHEPYKIDKRPYGLKKRLLVHLVEIIQKLSATYMDHIILPSEYAYTSFLQYYKNYKGTVHIAPLMVPDQKSGRKEKKEFFGGIGGPVKGTGSNDLIDIFNYVAREGLDYKFIWITSKDVSSVINNLSNGGKKHLKLINKPLISDDEINQVISQSFAIFHLSRETTQSGQIPVAFMNGTPVIARDTPGISQHVRHKYNGYLIPVNYSPLELIEAMEFIKENINGLSTNARTSYEALWAEHNFDHYYKFLLEL
jgi:glycosyltransferase involved in cell wall biosynthesis